MKTVIPKKSVIAACVLLGASQLSFAGKGIETRYIYEGDSDARSICLAIANNQVNRLNRALRAKKFSRLDNTVHERYKCNGQDLHTFAETMQSKKVAGYLAPKFGLDPTMEIVSTDTN